MNHAVEQKTTRPVPFTKAQMDQYMMYYLNAFRQPLFSTSFRGSYPQWDYHKRLERLLRPRTDWKAKSPGLFVPLKKFSIFDHSIAHKRDLPLYHAPVDRRVRAKLNHLFWSQPYFAVDPHWELLYRVSHAEYLTGVRLQKPISYRGLPS